MGAHGTNNKQQAMCSTHRDIRWLARAHQQDRDTLDHWATVQFFSLAQVSEFVMSGKKESHLILMKN